MSYNDIAMRYMLRFACTGADCPNHCCWGWRIIIDQANYEKVKLATRNSDKERKRFRRGVRVLKKKDRSPGGFAEFKLRENQLCPMLTDEGLCHIHGTFGEEFLCNTCSVYPRRLQSFGGNIEYTGVVSCPEVAQRLLLHPDSTDIVPYDRTRLPRSVFVPNLNRRPFRKVGRHPICSGVDPRDDRPYWRHIRDVRELMFRLVKMNEHPIERRLFFMTYFAERTVDILNDRLTDRDSDAVFKEIKLFDNPSMLVEIAERLDRFETPKSLVVLLAKALLKVGGLRETRTSLKELTRVVFESYAPAEEIEEWTQRLPSIALNYLPMQVIWPEFQRRKKRILARARDRVEQYLSNLVAHYWLHWRHVDSPNLLIHMLRLLGELAVGKFLLFSHPALQQALDKEELTQTSETDEERGTDGFFETLDRVAVEVFYKTSAFIEHGDLLKNMEKALEKNGLNSLAGAVYLARF